MQEYPSINIEPTGKWKVSKLKVNIPVSYQQIHNELVNENWVSPATINNLGNDNWGGVRFKCMQPKSEHTGLCQLKNYFSSGELKMKLIQWLYNTDESMNWDWEWRPEEMFRHTTLHGELTKDMPGFVNVLHTDYRKLVATGMVYLIDKDDPNLSTVFYDTADRANPVRIPTGFGAGWFHSNGNNTWHEGWNKTDNPRYSFLLGLSLNITPLGE